MPRTPSRGFRLYEIHLYRGQAQTALPFISDELNYAEHLEQIVNSHLLSVRLDRKPRLDAFTRAPLVETDDGNDDDDTPTAIFEVHDLRTAGPRVALTYRAGSIGSFRWAVPQGDGAPVDVSGHAVTNEQRAFFLLPPADGTRGLLIAESAGRAIGEHSLHRWLHAASKASNGGEPHWRLALDAVADPEHVRQLLDEHSLQEVVLSRREETADRSTTVEPFTIRAPLKTQYSRRQTADVLRGWANRESDPLSAREGAQQLAAIIDPRFRDVSFDDGYVRAQGDTDSGQQLRPDLAKDIFTYSLGTGWHSDASVLSRAKEVTDRLHGLSDLDLPWT